MVIDTSAIVAILFGEPDAQRFEASIAIANERRLSAVTRVELSCVVEGRKGEAGRADFDACLAAINPDIISVSVAQAVSAQPAGCERLRNLGFAAGLTLLARRDSTFG